MLNVISFIRNNAGLIIAGLFCLALWGLNVRNSQLTATNERLESLVLEKDKQVNQLHSKNDGLADALQGLTAAVRKQNEVMASVSEQKAITDRQNRALQNDIQRYLSADKCSLQPVPPAAANRLRENADRIRGGKD